MLLGRYEVIKKLGTGGFGEVLLARSQGAEGFERIVALKRLKGELARKEGSLQGIINEARIGGLLSHPNVVQVLEFIQVESDYLLVMEYVDGIGLQEVMELERTHQLRLLNSALAFDVAIQACEGLHYAHAARAGTGQPLKLIHRDIKPSNLMITRTGTVKVMDFGVARSVTNTGQSSTGSIKGTLRYLSPEQAEGSKDIRHESDLFSLGLVLTELIIGHPVYDADQEHVVLLKALQARVEAGVEEAEKQVPGLGSILKRCLAKMPEDRFRTADELGQALRTLRARQSSSDGGLATLVERAMLLRTPDPFKDELSTDTTFSLELRRKELAETRAVNGRGGRSRVSPGRIPDGRRVGASSPLVQIPGPRPGGDAPTEDMPRQLVKDILSKAAADPWEWEWRLHENDSKSWVGEVFDRASPPSSPHVPVQPPVPRERLQPPKHAVPSEDHQHRSTDPGRIRPASAPQLAVNAGSAPAPLSEGLLPDAPQSRPGHVPVRTSQGDAHRPPHEGSATRTTPNIPIKPPTASASTVPVSTVPVPTVPVSTVPVPTVSAPTVPVQAVPAPAVVSLWGGMVDIKALHETTSGTPIPHADAVLAAAQAERSPVQPSAPPQRTTQARATGEQAILPSPAAPEIRASAGKSDPTKSSTGLSGQAEAAARVASPPQGSSSPGSVPGGLPDAVTPALALPAGSRGDTKKEAEITVKEGTLPRPGSTSTPRPRAREMGDWESRSTTQINRSELPQMLEQAQKALHGDDGQTPTPALGPSSTAPVSRPGAVQAVSEPSAEPVHSAAKAAAKPEALLVEPQNIAPALTTLEPAAPALSAAPAFKAPGPVAAPPPTEPLEEIDALDDEDDDEPSAAEVSRMDMLAELESISIPSAHVAVIQQRMMTPPPERAKVRKPSITHPQARAQLVPPAFSKAPAVGTGPHDLAGPAGQEHRPDPSGSAASAIKSASPPAAVTPKGASADDASLPPARSGSSAPARDDAAASAGAGNTLSSSAADLAKKSPGPRADEDEDDEPSTGTISKRLRTARDRAAPKPFVTDTGEFSVTVTKMLLDAALKEEAEKAIAHVKEDAARGFGQDEVTDGPRAATRKVALAQLVQKPPLAVPGVALEDLPTRPGHTTGKKEETTVPVVRLDVQGVDAPALPFSPSDQEGTRTRRLDPRPADPLEDGPDATTRVVTPAGHAVPDPVRAGGSSSRHARGQSTSVLTVLGVEPDPGMRLTSGVWAFAALLGLGLLAAGFLLGVFWERAQHVPLPSQGAVDAIPAP